MDYSDEELDAAYDAASSAGGDSGSTWSDDELDAAYDSYQPEPSARDYVARFGADVAANIARPIGGAVRAAEDLFGTDTDFGETLARNAERTQQLAAERVPLEPGSAPELFERGLSGVAPYLAFGGAGALPLATAAGVQGGGSEYDYLRERGASPGLAALGGLGSGAASFAAGSLVFPRAFGGGGRYERYLAAPFANLIGGTGSQLADLAINAGAVGEVPSGEEIGRQVKEGAIVNVGTGLALGALGGRLKPPRESPVENLAARMREISAEQAAGAPPPLEAAVPEAITAPPADTPKTIEVRPDLPPEAPPASDVPADPLVREVLEATKDQAAEATKDEPSALVHPAQLEPPAVPVEAPKPVAAKQAEISFPEPITREPKQAPETPQVKPTLREDERGSLDIKPVGELAKGVSEYFDLLTKPEGSKEISNVEKFLEGRVFDRQLPGASHLLETTRRYLTFPRTMADKSAPWRLAYNGARGVERTNSAIVHDMMNTFEPYAKLSSAKRTPVNEALAAARSSTETDLPFNPTRENLAKLGLDADQQEGYLAYRKTMNQGLDILRSALVKRADVIADPEQRAERIKEVHEYIDGARAAQYVPFGRRGNRYVSVPDANDGKGHTSFHKTARGMQNEISKWRKLGFEPDFGRVNKPPQEAYDLPLNMMQGIASLDQDAMTELSKTLPPRGFAGHMIRAKLTPGFEKDLARSGVDYIQGLARYASHAEAAPAFKAALEGAKLGTKEHASIKRYVDDMKSGANGKTAKLRNFMNYYYLGGVTRQAAVNLTQNFTLTLPLLGEYTKNPNAEWGKAFAMGGEYLTNKGKFAKKYPELATSIEEAKRQGLLESDVKKDIARLRGGDTLGLGSKFLDAYTAMQSNSEYVNRLHSWIAGHNVATKLGLSPAEQFNLATKLTEDAHFVTTKSNRPELSRKFPLTTQFRAWNGNWLRAMRNSGGPTRLKMLGAMFALGGAAAVPGVAITMRTLQKFGIDGYDELRKLIGTGKGADLLLYGAPAAAGVNISGSLALTDPITDDTNPTDAVLRSAVGPAYDVLVARPRRALSLMSKYDHSLLGPPERGFVGRAGEALLPDALRHPAAALRAYQEGGFRGPGGNTVLSDPTTTELTLKSLGFTPTRLARAYERDQSAQLLKESQDATHEGFNYKVAKALRDNNRARLLELRTEIGDYNSSHRGTPIRIDPSAVRNKLREWADTDAAKIKRARKGADRRQMQELLQRR